MKKLIREIHNKFCGVPDCNERKDLVLNTTHTAADGTTVHYYRCRAHKNAANRENMRKRYATPAGREAIIAANRRYRARVRAGAIASVR